MLGEEVHLLLQETQPVKKDSPWHREQKQKNLKQEREKTLVRPHSQEWVTCVTVKSNTYNHRVILQTQTSKPRLTSHNHLWGSADLCALSPPLLYKMIGEDYPIRKYASQFFSTKLLLVAAWLHVWFWRWLGNDEGIWRCTGSTFKCYVRDVPLPDN